MADLLAAADFLGRAPWKLTDTRRKFSTSCGGGARLDNASRGAGDRTSVTLFRGDGDRSANGGAGICRSAEYCANHTIANSRGVGGAVKGAGFSDQLQPVRPGSDVAAKPVCVPAGERSGRCSGRIAAHPRRGAVERHRHVAEHCRPQRSTSAFSGKSRLGETPPRLARRRALWTGSRARSHPWWRVLRSR